MHSFIELKKFIQRIFVSTPKEYQLKHRLTGAVIIVLVGVVLIPVILQDPVIPPESPAQVQSADLSEEDTLTYLTNIVKENSREGEAESDGLSSEVATPAHVDSERSTQILEEPGSTGADEKPVLIMTENPVESENGSVPSAVTLAAPSPESSESSGKDKKAEAQFDEPSTTGWSVRVGTFAEERYEQLAIEKLLENNLDPKRTQVMTGAGQAIRVWIGPYSTEEEAKSVALSLKDITGQEGYVPKR